jgi:hypothetical protein
MPMRMLNSWGNARKYTSRLKARRVDDTAMLPEIGVLPDGVRPGIAPFCAGPA